MTTAGPASDAVKDVAFYYPGPFWHSASWIKNLLLFFDGIALLIPAYMRDRPAVLEPEMAIPLTEAGLLHILEPEALVDKEATEHLTAALTNVLTSGALDSLTTKRIKFEELSWSRLGGYGNEGLATMIVEELKRRGLARDTEDGVSIPMHPMVRSLVLVLLAQILRPYGKHQGLNLSPATDRADLVRALEQVLAIDAAPSSGHVVSLDLRTVGVDLAGVPLDEVLAYRREHLAAHRRYAANVRRFVRDLSLLPDTERKREFEGRENEIRDVADSLHRLSKKAWKRPAGFALSIAGAAWTVKTGDPLGAALSIGGAILGLESTSAEAGAYSYIFRVGKHL
jgi:hypothetical protein